MFIVITAEQRSDFPQFELVLKKFRVARLGFWPPITFLIGPAMGFPASGPGMTGPPC
ncbi:hypothetical protein ACIQB5_51350 [Streptomyces sp. NPDC088560]|uniref:hypothetical protein n=1 Tax=Streptomyces sp. NPDC088560 TaxID=3365868 RepID=UPI00381095DD